MSTADGYKTGAKVYMVTSIKKKDYTITEGVITTDVNPESIERQLIYVKHPSPFDTRALYEHRAYVSLTDLSKYPWRLTPEDAVKYMINRKNASMDKYHRAIKNVEKQLEVLHSGPSKLRVHEK